MFIWGESAWRCLDSEGVFILLSSVLFQSCIWIPISDFEKEEKKTPKTTALVLKTKQKKKKGNWESIYF